MIRILLILLAATLLLFPLRAENQSVPVEELSAEYFGATENPDPLANYDWDIRVARAVMLAESGGDHLVVNDNPATGDYSVGLFQINLYGKLAASRPSEEWLKVPENNIAYAYTLYKEGGWNVWSAYKTGAYLKYYE